MAKVIVSDSTNPYENLAFEEWLFENLAENERILLLWQNDNTVVIGNGQSVYSQCDLKVLSLNDTHIARRKSGGGAVYHDSGNLNFSLLSNCATDSLEENFRFIQKVLQNLTLNVELSGRNDILLEGKKISGNAYYKSCNKLCHHGTILIDCNLKKMEDLLTVDVEKWKDKGIDSVRSRVMNLSDFDSGINVEIVKEAFRELYVKQYDATECVAPEKDVYKSLIEKYASPNWIYEKQLDENCLFKKKFSWGLIEFHLRIENNNIKECRIDCDSLVVDLFETLEDALCECKFRKKDIEIVCEKLADISLSAEEKIILLDIKNMLVEEVVF